MGSPTLQDRAEYTLSRALETVIAHLPGGVAQSLGGALGGLIRAPLAIRRETVLANLSRAFPDATPDWIDEVARQSYRHLGLSAIEMIRLSHMSPGEVIARTEIPVEAWAAFQEARGEGKGVLLVTGHYGNWEAAAAAMAARGVPIEAIVKRQRNRLVDGQVEAARHRMGVSTMDMAEAPKRMLRALSQNHVIGMVADQDARRAGVFVPFFGIPSSTYRGPAMFALRFGIPIFSAVARRLSGGRYQVDGVRIPVESSGDLEADVIRVTTLLANHLENEIRKEPGQYFWFHKRWKTAPPTEPVRTGPGNVSLDIGES